MAVTVNAAVYGVGVYGTAVYGKVIVSNLDQVEGTGQAGNPQVNLVEKPTGVSVTGSIGVLEHSNTKTLTGVEGTGAIEAVVAGGFEIDITERITGGVEGTGQVAGVQANPGAGLTGVSATGSIGSLDHSNTTLLQSVVGTLPAPSVEPQITEKISGVSATGAVGSTTHSNTTLLTAVVANGVAGQTTETGVLFDFFAVREQYDRRRTIKIPRAA